MVLIHPEDLQIKEKYPFVSVIKTKLYEIKEGYYFAEQCMGSHTKKKNPIIITVHFLSQCTVR